MKSILNIFFLVLINWSAAHAEEFSWNLFMPKPPEPSQFCVESTAMKIDGLNAGLKRCFVVSDSVYQDLDSAKKYSAILRHIDIDNKNMIILVAQASSWETIKNILDSHMAAACSDIKASVQPTLAASSVAQGMALRVDQAKLEVGQQDLVLLGCN